MMFSVNSVLTYYTRIKVERERERERQADRQRERERERERIDESFLADCGLALLMPGGSLFLHSQNTS